MNYLKNTDYKFIISEIKKSRKGALMIVFIICLMCAFLDYFLRRHGIILDWFIQYYVIVGISAFMFWSVKLYNKMADETDERDLADKFKKHYANILDKCNDEEVEFLKKFVCYNEAVRIIKDNEFYIVKNLIAKQIDFLTVVQTFPQYEICISAWGLNFLKEYFKR